MHREIFIACLPYLIAIFVCIAVLWCLIWLSGVRLRIAHLFRLHRDEAGGVQSLSFVLTLPLFIIIMMFIVQLSQITIAKVVVEYSAFAAARSAIVWIPATTGMDEEMENEISQIYRLEDVQAENGKVYSVYEVAPGSPKYNKIHMAAAMACMPVCPSRDVGVSRDNPGNAAADSMERAYLALAPSSASNSRIRARLENKLAYALENTRIQIRVHHKESEPPLQTQYGIGPYPREFSPNEIGWQDQLHVTVNHDFALLPGPGRLLARRADARPGTEPEASYGENADGSDSVEQNIKRQGGVYVYTLTATARLNNEGEKSVLPYIQPLDGPVTPLRIRRRGDDDNYFEERFYDRDIEYYWRELINYNN